MAAGRGPVTADGAPACHHASVVVIGETGILIEGASGSGKSSLAAALVDEAPRASLFGRLVGDDRVALEARHGRLIARPHPAIAGLIERRGSGLVAMPYEGACVVGLAVILAAAADHLGDRLPERPPTCERAGVTLPLLVLRSAAGARENAARVLQALSFERLRCNEPF